MAGRKGRSGGARPGAGRPKKPPVLAVLAPTADPLAWLRAAMADNSLDMRLRIDAAKALLPFVHARKGDAKKVERLDAAKEAAKGKYSPMAPPKLAAVRPIK